MILKWGYVFGAGPSTPNFATGTVTITYGSAFPGGALVCSTIVDNPTANAAVTGIGYAASSKTGVTFNGIYGVGFLWQAWGY